MRNCALCIPADVPTVAGRARKQAQQKSSIEQCTFNQCSLNSQQGFNGVSFGNKDQTDWPVHEQYGTQQR